MITTVRLEKVTIFLRKYHDSKTVALKEYSDYSLISTYTESLPGGTVGYPAQPGLTSGSTWRNRRLPSPTRINLEEP